MAMCWRWRLPRTQPQCPRSVQIATLHWEQTRNLSKCSLVSRSVWALWLVWRGAWFSPVAGLSVGSVWFEHLAPLQGRWGHLILQVRFHLNLDVWVCVIGLLSETKCQKSFYIFHKKYIYLRKKEQHTYSYSFLFFRYSSALWVLNASIDSFMRQ